MAFIRLSRFKASAEVVSSILNWVCPECGGRMGGRGSEFECHGERQIDWRQLWEQVLAAGRPTRVPSMQRPQIPGRPFGTGGAPPKVSANLTSSSIRGCRVSSSGLYL